MKGAKENRSVPWSGAPDCPVCHRIVSGAPGWINSNLPPSGFWKCHSAIIHRTVRCSTGLSGVPAEQRLQRNGWLQRKPEKCYSARTVRAESEQALEGAPDSEQWLSDAPPGCQSSNGWTQMVGWRGWRIGQCLVAHRTVQCAHRQQTSPTAVLVVEAINTPNHHHSRHPSFSDISLNTRASAFNTRHNPIESKPLQVPILLKAISD
jgi:hypothetical protein